MSQEEKQLEDQLRYITRGQSQGAADPARDPQRLTETWRTLSRLLAAEQRSFDSIDTLKQVRRRVFRHRARQFSVFAAAAVLVIAVGLGWITLLGKRGEQPAPMPGNSTIAKQQSGDNRQTVAKRGKEHGVVHAPVRSPAPSSAVASVPTNESGGDLWNSTIDNQIAQLDKQVQAGLTLTRQTDRQIEALSEQLTSFRQEVDADSL